MTAFKPSPKASSLNHSRSDSTELSNRREFLKTSSATVAAGVIAPAVMVKPKAFAANDETLRVGLIGLWGAWHGGCQPSHESGWECDAHRDGGHVS